MTDPVKHEPNMHFKHDFTDECPYCKYEVADYCSRCTRPLSEDAKVLNHKLKLESLPKLEELMKNG